MVYGIEVNKYKRNGFSLLLFTKNCISLLSLSVCCAAVSALSLCCERSRSCCEKEVTHTQHTDVDLEKA